MESSKPPPKSAQSAKESTRPKPPTSAKTVRTKTNSKEQSGKEKKPREDTIQKNKTTQPPESLAEDPSASVAPAEGDPSSSPTQAQAAPPARPEGGRSQSLKPKVGRGAGAGEVGREWPPFKNRSKEKEIRGVGDEKVEGEEKEEEEIVEICISCGLPK